jgi:hypothetical protein
METPVVADRLYQERPKIDHTIKKPQLAWWSEIGNSYYPFIPILTTKPHAKSPIPD